MNYNNYNSKDDEKDLAYDLRQGYAKIIEGHLIDCTNAERERNYPDFYRFLSYLFTATKHRFKNKKEDEAAYESLKQKAIVVFTKYKLDYLRTRITDEGTAQVESVLLEMFSFLYEKINEANIFGGKYEDEGL